MFGIKTAFFVQGIMKFTAGDAGVTGTVKMTYKIIHQVKKFIFIRIVMLAVKPEYFVTSYEFVMYRIFVVSRAS